MPNSDPKSSDANDRDILDRIYALEDARTFAEKVGELTLRYFIEMALAYAKNMLGAPRDAAESPLK